MNHKPLFLTVALIALLVIAGAFWFMKQRQAAMNQPPIIITEPVVEAPVQTEPEKYPQHIEAIPGNTDEVWYNIPELGIRMKLNKEFAEDLVYVYRHEKDDEGGEWDNADFSLKELERVVPGCGGYSNLTKSKGDLKEMKKNKYTLDPYLAARLDDFIQAGDYYYGWAGFQDVCWDSSLEKKVREVFPPGKYKGMGAKNMPDGLETIELIPKR